MIWSLCKPTVFYWTYWSYVVSMLDTRFNCGINFQIKGKLLEKKSFKFLTLIMFLFTDSDFQRGGSEGFCIRHLPIPAHWKSESVNTSKLRYMDGYTVILLLENSFVMYTLPNFEFYVLNLQWCKRFFISVWATCEKTSLAYIEVWIFLFVFICLLTSFRIWKQNDCSHAEENCVVYWYRVTVYA